MNAEGARQETINRIVELYPQQIQLVEDKIQEAISQGRFFIEIEISSEAEHGTYEYFTNLGYNKEYIGKFILTW